MFVPVREGKGDMTVRAASFCVFTGVITLLLATRPVHAIVNQSDGTIVPVGTSLQSCLDKSRTYDPVTNPAPGDGTMPFRINAVQDARTQPQTFAIPAAAGGGRQISTFTHGHRRGIGLREHLRLVSRR